MGNRFFVIDGYEAPVRQFLPNKIYSKVLDQIVIACVDIMLTNSDGMIFLGKRSRYPIKTWWVLGGRMFPGENFADTARRNVLKEAGLSIPFTRFQYVDTIATVNGIRDQEPTGNGSHTVNVVMWVKITEEEVNHIRLNDEYGDSRWVYPEDILTNELYLPVLKAYVGTLKSKKLTITLDCDEILCPEHSLIHGGCEKKLDPESCRYTGYIEGRKKGVSECLDCSIFSIIWEKILKLIQRVV